MTEALRNRMAPGPRLIVAGIAAAFAGIAAGFPASAQDGAPKLDLPIDCVAGQSCWISKFLDLDPGPGVRDYMCTGRANDAHSGIDIALRDLRAMDEGVAVLAAAPGTVLRGRDGMQDISAREAGPDMIRGGECGNGVMVDHGGGWMTQYCHMRQGSIAVKLGEHVAAGQKLGLVGMSGSSEYPHLHLSVYHGKKLVDPFVGLEDRSPVSAKCGLGAAPLWSEKALAQLAYTPAAIYNVGFADRKPGEKDVSKGRFRETDLSAAAPVLIFWSEIFGVEAGDTLHLRLLAPDGKALVDHTASIPARKARWYQYVGKKRPGFGWPEGTYQGEITLTRTQNGETQTTQRSAQVRIGGAAPPPPAQ
jgi:hypothetical protein